MSFRRLMNIVISSFSIVFPALIARVEAEEARRADDPFAAQVAKTDPRTPEDERKAFHLPPGFDIELVAAEPEIHKPLNIAFDAKGRLWVTETVEYPFPVVKPGVKPRDALKVLSDFAADGRARSVVTFADGLNIPIGVIPVDDGAIVHSIPQILHLVDTDGDGRADRRDVFYATFAFADTHGMTNAFTKGFDGWIYACHGFSNTSTVSGSDQKKIVMQSGNVYRMRPDGSHVEYFTHGQVNPFGLAFDPLGNLFSCDCHSRPIYQLLRGAYYPSFGKPDDGLGFGPEMMTHDHGSTAISGIVYYSADHFPKTYQDTIMIGNVVTNRINFDRLEKHGSTLLAIPQADFLVSDDPWFRPVDLEIGPDGAIYVADFYNRIIGHYEVPLTHPGRDRERGRIWRIVYRGEGGERKPIAPRADWTKANLSDLIHDLSHPNLVVRMTAANELVRRGGAEVVAAANGVVSAADSTSFEKIHALWILERLGKIDGATLKRAAVDSDRGVRTHAMRILGEAPTLADPERSLAVNGLKDEDAFVRRSAAEALGRHARPDAIRPLLDLRRAVAKDDTHLLHVVRMALRDQLLIDSAWSEIATDRYDDADRRAIADCALGAPTAASARFLLDHVSKATAPIDRLADTIRHIARYLDLKHLSDLLTFAHGYRENDLTIQSTLVRSVERGLRERGAAIDGDVRGWALATAKRLFDAKTDDRSAQAIELASSLKLGELRNSVEGLANDKSKPDARRVQAIKALVDLDPAATIDSLSHLLTDSSESILIRETAAGELARINRPASIDRLGSALPTVPGRLQATIAFQLAGSPAGAEALLKAVEAGKASPRLLQERPVALRLEHANPNRLGERIAALTKNLPPADARIAELLKKRGEGFFRYKDKLDSESGRLVFEKNCAICHQFQGKGARIGPQLEGIGVRGADRLMEDILDPNRNVDQTFRVTNLALKSGELVSGLVLREEGAIVVVADSQGKEIRVRSDQIEERATAQLSPMPADLADRITETDFYQLIGYLIQSSKATK